MVVCDSVRRAFPITCYNLNPAVGTLSAEVYLKERLTNRINSQLPGKEALERGHGVGQASWVPTNASFDKNQYLTCVGLRRYKFQRTRTETAQ